MQINIVKTITAKYTFVTLLLSFIFVLASVFIPAEINNKKEQLNVRLGLPLKFLKQDQTRLDPAFPVKVNINSPWESPTRISWIKFSFSVIFIFIVLYLISMISLNLLKKRHAKMKLKFLD